MAREHSANLLVAQCDNIHTNVRVIPYLPAVPLTRLPEAKAL